ncbi:hypothetical protein [Marilutibacter chinensis]|uniref:Uncharacterized protein n=1 Tax=Marilutibacter chinensis TaxID=2912247 RepID=A0ABS9HY49_9GAMM|nr:hypothetical protein [Lysobacter chinensis]MCF7223791.1 hypothetical protein [Lysobacter chinensis]
MTVNASNRTLGLINIWQVLRKLCWELWLIKSVPDKLRMGVKPKDVLHVQDAGLYATVNAASTALALVDWLYHTVREDQTLERRLKDVVGEIDTSSDKAFLAFFRQANPSINACHQICNANKHFYLYQRSLDPKFKARVFEFVMERPDGTTELGTSAQIIRNGDGPGTVMPTYEMLNNLADWWESLLSDIGVSGREQFFPQHAP